VSTREREQSSNGAHGIGDAGSRAKFYRSFATEWSLELTR
jgi:hypothetical protein